MTRQLGRESAVTCPLVAGVDEAGRGALAGPVTAAAVMLNPQAFGNELTDSKKLTASRRERFEPAIKQRAVAWSVGWASVAEIDTHNILEATFIAMRRALAELSPQPAAAWIDGNQSPGPSQHCRTVVGGDVIQPAISAASILAKVARDREMAELGSRYPDFGLAAHKGYGTPGHRQAIAELGPTPTHRHHFAPVAAARSQQELALDAL